ncbi:unnamed protein product, partial [Brassica rapa]
KSRNKLLFQNKNMHWRNVLRFARNDAIEWKVTDAHQERVNSTDQTQNQRVDELKRWRLPTQGRLKCNVDGSFYNETIEAAAGWVLRNEEGQFIGATQARGGKIGTALESE